MNAEYLSAQRLKVSKGRLTQSQSVCGNAVVSKGAQMLEVRRAIEWRKQRGSRLWRKMQESRYVFCFVFTILSCIYVDRSGMEDPVRESVQVIQKPGRRASKVLIESFGLCERGSGSEGNMQVCKHVRNASMKNEKLL